MLLSLPMSVVLPPSPIYSSNWTPLFVLIGWLSLLGLLGFLAVVVFLLLRTRRESEESVDRELEASSDGGSGKETALQGDTFLKDLGLLFLHLLSFFASWLMWAALVWLGVVLYISLLLEADFKLWHYVVPYLLFLLTFPFTSLTCLKVWSGIKRNRGEEKRRYFQYRKFYSLVQLFLSAVFISLSGIIFLIIFGIVFSMSGFDSETIRILGLPLIPGLLSFAYLIWYLAEFVLLRREAF